MMASLERSLLHVEGTDDFHAICHLLIRSGIDYDRRAPWKGAVSQRVRIPPGNCRSSQKQSERCKEATNWTEALR